MFVQSIERSVVEHKVFDIGTLRFTKAGTYVYEMREVDQVPAGFTFDPSLYTLTIEVTEVSGVLKQTAVVTKNNGTTPEAGMVYVNKYVKPLETSTSTGGATTTACADGLYLCADGIACLSLAGYTCQ